MSWYVQDYTPAVLPSAPHVVRTREQARKLAVEWLNEWRDHYRPARWGVRREGSVYRDGYARYIHMDGATAYIVKIRDAG